MPICTFFGSEDVTDTYAAGDTLLVQIAYEMERCPESLMIDREAVTVETEEEALDRYDGRGIFVYYAEGVLILLVPLATTPLGEAESITLPTLTEGMTPERLLSQMRITPEEVNMISCTFLDADQQDQESYIPGETAWIGLLQDVRPEALTVNGEEIPLCAGVMEIKDYLDAGLSCGVDLMGQYGIFISLLEEGDEGACFHNIRVSVAHKDVTCTENGVEGEPTAPAAVRAETRRRL